MKRHNKWVIGAVALTTVGLVVGCGRTPTAPSESSTSGSNTVSKQSPATASSPITFETQTVTVEPNVRVSVQIPSGWTKQDAGAGDTGGSKWVNPKNSNQWIRILYSGNVGALQNNSGNYDVTSYINTPGVTWTSVSPDKLSGQFTIPVGSINNTIEGYGYAQVMTSPSPIGVGVEAVAPENIAQTVTQSAKVQSSNTTTALTVMPKPRLWTEITSSEDATVNTGYGKVKFSPQGITQNDITVSLTTSGQKSTLYTLHNSSFKRIEGWQLDGRYLAVQLGFPPSSNPATGNYSHHDVVIDLQSHREVLSQGTTIQSNDYLAEPFFVQSVIDTIHGTPQSIVNVTNLTTQQHISLELPQNSLGLGIVSSGTLYYTAVNGTKHQIVSMVLPTTGWQSATDTSWKPIQLS